jgi:hypothetical protein
LSGTGIVVHLAAMPRIMRPTTKAGRPNGDSRRAGLWLVAAALAGAAPIGAIGEAAEPIVPTIPWTETAIHLRTQHYNARRFNCPPVDDARLFAVWGTDIYTDHSSICAAAVHAGIITGNGGEVTIQEVDGLENYDATARNGVASRHFSAWFFSFQFIRSR